MIGGVLTLGAVGLYGTRTAMSVAIGAGVAIANLAVLRAIMRAILSGTETETSTPASQDASNAESTEAAPHEALEAHHVAEGKRAGSAWALFAVMKILVLFGGVWILLTRGLVDPIPLVVGYGVLPLGISVSGIFASLVPKAAPRGR